MAAELEQLRVSLVAELVGREAFEQLKREVNQVKAATAGLDTAQNNLRKTTDAAAGAVRQQRQAFAQTGMQINQFAGQVAAGTPIMTAFVQQIGDVAYVMGQAGESGGKLARFLQGPLAAGLLIGISILGPLIAKFIEARDVLADTAVTSKETEDAIKSYYAVIGYKEPIQKAIAENQKLIKTIIMQREESLKAAQAELTRLNVIAKVNMSLIRSEDNIFRRIFGDNPAEQQAKAKGTVKALKAEIKSLRDALKKPIELPKVTTPKISTPTIRNDIKKDVEKVQTLDDVMSDIQNTSAIFGRNFIKEADKIGESIEKTGLESLGDNITKSIETASSAVEQMQRPIDRIKSMSEAMGQAFSDGIKGMITGAMSFKQVMGNVIDAVINKLFEMFVVQQIVGFISGALTSAFGATSKANVSSSVNSLSSKAISGLSSIPGRAIGGPVQAGGAYMVGERGPEMFVPSRSGSIVPNNGLGGGMTINVDARGASDPAAVRAQVEMGIAQAAPYIIAAAQNRTLKTAARPRLPGTLG